MKVIEYISINGKLYPHEREETSEERAARERQEAEYREHERMREPTDTEKIDAQILYTALMTDTLLEV